MDEHRRSNFPPRSLGGVVTVDLVAGPARAILEHARSGTQSLIVCPCTRFRRSRESDCWLAFHPVRPFYGQAGEVFADQVNDFLRFAVRNLALRVGWIKRQAVASDAVLFHAHRRHKASPGFLHMAIGAFKHDSSHGRLQPLWIEMRVMGKFQGRAFPGMRGINRQSPGVPSARMIGQRDAKLGMFQSEVTSRFEVADGRAGQAMSIMAAGTQALVAQNQSGRPAVLLVTGSAVFREGSGAGQLRCVGMVSDPAVALQAGHVTCPGERALMAFIAVGAEITMCVDQTACLPGMIAGKRRFAQELLCILAEKPSHWESQKKGQNAEKQEP